MCFFDCQVKGTESLSQSQSPQQVTGSCTSNLKHVFKWTVFALINAEELGITKDNIGDQMKSRNPAVKRLVGTEGDFGTPLGLTKGWAARATVVGGNDEEIFERNLGMESSLKIQRGLNNLWNKGGLIYAPPFR